MTGTTITVCQACGGPVRGHCTSPTCNWWACTVCCSYGNDKHCHQDDRRRGQT